MSYLFTLLLALLNRVKCDPPFLQSTPSEPGYASIIAEVGTPEVDSSVSSTLHTSMACLGLRRRGRLLLWLWLLVSPASALSERPLATGSPRSTKDLFNREWESVRNIRDVRGKLSRFDRFVPVIGRKKDQDFVAKRREMFRAGVYPGVEYRVLDIFLEDQGVRRSIPTLQNYTAASDSEAVVLRVRPAYKLIPELERAWPVEVDATTIPFVLTRGAYNIATVIGSSGLAFSFLLSALVVSSVLTFSVVNSKSMVPAILPKDVILVEKATPLLRRALNVPYAPSSVVFFRPPPAFEAYLKSNGLPPIQGSTLVVKRIRGDPAVRETRGCLSVLGDNEAASLDSRFWGCLPLENVVGSPVLRILPLNRFGPISGTSTSTINSSE